MIIAERFEKLRGSASPKAAVGKIHENAKGLKT
jgi:hypothetical protein